MKIAVATDFFPKIPETFIVNLITGLLDAGHEVDVFANSTVPGEAVHEDVYRYRLLDRTYYLPARRTANRVMRKIQSALSRGKILLVPTRWKYLFLSQKRRYILSHWPIFAAPMRFDIPG
jgi:colanic acid/amylovoran biosynthesis glycosyltransferase